MALYPVDTKKGDSKNADSKKYNMHLIINTHWDREYRWSFCETQMRLVEAVDILLDTMEKDPRFKYFHTDSQASFLDDYLELRPENRRRVEKLVGEGRLLAGPWYTLPAEFLVSGEALVRNLLMGHKIAGDMGGVMKAGYNIFSWGQVSQLPQIYRQFGMDTILFYRGIDQSNIDKLEFNWQSPDGTNAMGITFGSYHRLNFWVYVYRPYIDIDAKAVLSRDGSQGFLANLCDSYSHDINHHFVNQGSRQDLIAALNGMDTLLDTVKDKASTPELLFLQGFDQENPDPIVPDLVEAINSKIDYGKVTISSLPEYIEKVKESLKKQGIENDLNQLTGEMLNVERSGDPFAPLYIGVFSARMPLKQMNTACEYLLEKWAEPSAVWAMLAGRRYPESVLEKAWRQLLQNQQHDGIGGCHVDRITTSMIERYDNARDISETVTRDSLTAVIQNIDMSDLDSQQIGLVIFNSSPQARSGEVVCTVDIPHKWGLRYIPGTLYKNELGLDVYDDSGEKIRSQILEQDDDTVYTYLKYGSATNFEATRIKAALKVDGVPAMGYKCLKVEAKNSVDRPVETLTPEPNVLENEYIRAEIQFDGTVNIYDKANNVSYDGLNYFEDSGEAGGPLIHCPPNKNQIYTTKGRPADISLVHSGPLMSRYCIEHEWLLPEGLFSEAKIHVPHGKKWIDNNSPQRSPVKVPLRMRTEVTLCASSRKLEFETFIDNTIKDHRLRVGFPTGKSGVTHCSVDTPFDVVCRDIRIPDSSGWYEEAAKTLPCHSFVDVSDEKSGLALMHWGLPEYEVVDNKNRSIMLTLLRCFGTAGNPTETYEPQPLAQCQGSRSYKYAVYCHSGDFRKGRVAAEANEYTTALRVAQCSGHEGVLPKSYSFFSVDNDNFIVTALKKAQYSDDVVLRGFNTAGKAIKVKLSSTAGIKSAYKITLEEKDDCRLEVKDCNKVSFEAGTAEIVSIRLSLETSVKENKS
jgi:mannosylglycerate hydrolase